MKSAFLKRAETCEVSIFYPYEYEGFLQTSWDLVVIEGWFTLIDEFLTLARLHSSPSAVILFYCLDPVFPGMDVVRGLGVDGFLTNSLSVREELSGTVSVPVQYLPLAADPQVMRPPTSPPEKQRGVVYVGKSGVCRDWCCCCNRCGVWWAGAGGYMLSAKKFLVGMLEAAAPFSLDIFGSHWSPEEVPMVSEEVWSRWRGPLHRTGIAEVYSSSGAVLSCTIDSQREAGMVNNRVFEALACGALLVTDSSPELLRLFSMDGGGEGGELPMVTVDRPEEVAGHLQRILTGSSTLEKDAQQHVTQQQLQGRWREMRRRAREVILFVDTLGI